MHELQPTLNTRPRLFYGYIIVAVAVIIQIIAWGQYNSYGVFFNQLLADYRWPRETISGAFSLAQLVIGAGAILLGILNDRFGPRLLMTFEGILAGVGFILMSQVHEIWQLYLFQGVIVGIGLSGTDIVLLGTTARWFVKRRGIMSGIVKMGTGTGIMALPVINAWLIGKFDWRITLIIVGSALVLLVVAGAQLLRRDPAGMNLLPDGVASRPGAGAVEGEKGFSLLAAGRTRQFWMLCGAYFVILFATNTVIVHIAPFAVDLKTSESFAAAMVSVVGGVSIAGRLVMGFVSDRVGSRPTLLTCFIIFVAAFAWLQVVGSMWALLVFAVVYGFAHGGFYAILSPAVADLFGTRSHGIILGIIVFFASLGGALGPILTGRIFDLTTSYQLAFLILLVLAAVGLLMILFSGARKPGAVLRV